MGRGRRPHRKVLWLQQKQWGVAGFGGAGQVALKAACDADPADGWAKYHALCASGSSKTYAETLAAAGLPLPYAPGVVERLAGELSRQL